MADLAPEGLVGADEGPLGRLLHQALSVLVGVADVEHLSTGCFKKRVIFKGTVQLNLQQHFAFSDRQNHDT